MNINFFINRGESIEFCFEYEDENGILTRENVKCGVSGQDKPRTFYLNLNGNDIFQSKAWNEKNEENEIVDESERTYFGEKL